MASIKYIVLFFVLLFYGCKDKKQQNSELMEQSFRKDLFDIAFSNNSKLEIFELNSLGYDTLNENFIDTLKIIEAKEQINKFDQLANANIDIIKSNLQLAKLYLSLGSETLSIQYKDNAKDYANKSQDYLDSMAHYIKVDSLIRKKINERKNPEIIFRSKYFLKATFSKDSVSQNILDTLFIYFDKNLKIIRQ
jgi:hypothetical protein